MTSTVSTSACAGDTRIAPSAPCGAPPRLNCDMCGAPLCYAHARFWNPGILCACMGCDASAVSEEEAEESPERQEDGR